MGARPADARVHRAARPAGVHARRERQHLGTGDRAHAAARRRREQPSTPSPTATPSTASTPSESAATPHRLRPRAPAPIAASSRAASAASAAAAPESPRHRRQRPAPHRAPSRWPKAIRSPRSRAACMPIHPANIDQTMIALYRANPDAFGGNINILRRGAVLRVPGADDIAALNQREAMGEVHRQMDAWRSAGGSGSAQRTFAARHAEQPAAAGPAPGNASRRAAIPVTQALKDRVKDLEGQLADSEATDRYPQPGTCGSCRRSSARRRRLAAAAPRRAPAKPPATRRGAAAAPGCVHPRWRRPRRPALPSPRRCRRPNPIRPLRLPPAPKPAVKKPAPPVVSSGSWLDWLQDNCGWWAPCSPRLLRSSASSPGERRKQSSIGSPGDFGSGCDETHVAGSARNRRPSFIDARKGHDSIRGRGVRPASRARLRG